VVAADGECAFSVLILVDARAPSTRSHRPFRERWRFLAQLYWLCDAADVTEISYQQVLSGARRLDAVSAGPSDAVAFVFHGGTPTAAVRYQPAVDAVLARGLRYVGYSRPGYAGSDPQPGCAVADAAAIDRSRAGLRNSRWPVPSL
jgi:hypothetical protein